MRGVLVFSGTSHPTLTEAICDRLGTLPAPCELRKFSNGETSVNIGASVRNQDVYIVQSGSRKINDSVMELLIMISACKGGSAKSITAVMPYFPYSRQSKKKSHRGAITARMLANLLSVAGVDHVVTVDLHASQMQGFFGKPVDNLFAEPLIARWIRMNVPQWNEAVVVTKNAGGSKRVTSLADALKLNFGIVTTDRRRQRQAKAGNMTDSAIFFDSVEQGFTTSHDGEQKFDRTSNPNIRRSFASATAESGVLTPRNSTSDSSANPAQESESYRTPHPDSMLAPSTLADGFSSEYTDERAREVITGRLVQGHLVDDDYPSPETASTSASASNHGADTYEGSIPDPMSMSAVSNVSGYQPGHALGGSFDAAASSDEEDAVCPQRSGHERMITLVGDVKDKTVFIVDDMIDRASSWIAAAETVVKKGGAKKVYCIATHGIFGDDSMEQMENCPSIDYVVVTNSFPLPIEKVRLMKKLVVLDLSALLSESIRRHHNGERLAALVP
ncbi:ribose-phosphate pyrophosphokinase 1 [Nannizzia gypsea CBS 118893]|uniref:Ribose-phosphate pyrophosphokinase 1 n=1 Tax=Arthroderma gypseum (strain ATCC MYA-4604 / CBS 118893) TaxID=535722 RepID=E4UN10_ARTGP|nr:ribose-phosphate pyrophosphokinase 1 [Nannizzia gypsea CBS 118893]EFQ99524.1 ribose-phosphate pyrophosphokinase 1 [Nannizzia gypsea CBS 118893]